MLKIFIGIILFYITLSNSKIEYATNDSNSFLPKISEQYIFKSNPIVPPLIPATPIKNENWNEYIVLTGNNFLNNYYIKPIRIKKMNYSDINA
jgi:hypothetical protein